MFYFLVNGGALVNGLVAEKSMKGVIVPFEDFLAKDDQALLKFDIILGACIGKWEMLKRCVFST